MRKRKEKNKEEGKVEWRGGNGDERHRRRGRRKRWSRWGKKRKKEKEIIKEKEE